MLQRHHTNAGSEEKGFFSFRMGDLRLLIAECELEVVSQKGFDLLFDFRSFRMAPTDRNQPIVGVAEISDPDKSRVVHYQ